MHSESQENKGQSWAINNYFMGPCTNRIVVFNNLLALICSQPRNKENHGCAFLLFKYFLNNLLLTAFMQMGFQNSSNYCNKK